MIHPYPLGLGRGVPGGWGGGRSVRTPSASQICDVRHSVDASQRGETWSREHPLCVIKSTGTVPVQTTGRFQQEAVRSDVDTFPAARYLSLCISNCVAATMTHAALLIALARAITDFLGLVESQTCTDRWTMSDILNADSSQRRRRYVLVNNSQFRHLGQLLSFLQSVEMDRLPDVTLPATLRRQLLSPFQGSPETYLPPGFYFLPSLSSGRRGWTDGKWVVECGPG